MCFFLFRTKESKILDIVSKEVDILTEIAELQMKLMQKLGKKADLQVHQESLGDPLGLPGILSSALFSNCCWFDSCPDVILVASDWRKRAPMNHKAKPAIIRRSVALRDSSVAITPSTGIGGACTANVCGQCCAVLLLLVGVT